MNTYQVYSHYKESNIEWVGTMPEKWEIKPLYGVANTESIKNEGGKEANVLSLSYGNIIKRDVEDNFGLLPESFNTYQLVNAGELILRLTDLQNDKRSLRVGHAKEKGIITSAYLKLIAKKNKLNDRFFYRLLHSYDTTKVFYGMGGGLRQSMKFEEMRRLPILVPTLIEQEKIANFLDHETAKIDTLIEKQQQLIKLLKEKRQSVISHAVTKGLNHNTPMRDSGVEWLGEVPEHWIVIKFGITNLSADLGGNYSAGVGEEGLPLIKMGNLGRGKIKLEKLEFILKNEVYEDCHLLKNGDFLFNTRNSLDLVGKVSIWREELGKALYNSNVLKIIFDNKFVGSTSFINYLFNSDLGLSQLRLIARGTTNVAAIYYKDLSSLIFSLPAPKEQIEIVSFLEQECDKVDYLIGKAEEAIVLMQEHRTALISAAVTGKIDVRKWQPPEPTNNKNNKEVAA